MSRQGSLIKVGWLLPAAILDVFMIISLIGSYAQTSQVQDVLPHCKGRLAPGLSSPCDGEDLGLPMASGQDHLDKCVEVAPEEQDGEARLDRYTVAKEAKQRFVKWQDTKGPYASSSCQTFHLSEERNKPCCHAGVASEHVGRRVASAVSNGSRLSSCTVRKHIRESSPDLVRALKEDLQLELLQVCPLVTVFQKVSMRLLSVAALVSA